MFDVFKVSDAKLLEEIYQSFDKNKQGYLEIQELVGGMVFFLRGKFEYKLALYFEVYMNYDGDPVISKSSLVTLLTDCLKLYKEVFDSAKKIADAMNTSLDGKIKFDEFKAFCDQFPSAMDFLGRLTIGNYPYSYTVESKLKKHNNMMLSSNESQQLSIENALSQKMDEKQFQDIVYATLIKDPKTANKRWVPRVNE